MQIPLVLIHELTAITYRDIIEVFLEISQNSFPLLTEIRDFLTEKARSVQQGNSEYCKGKKGISDCYFAPDIFMLLTICSESKVEAFYQESEEILAWFLKSRHIYLPLFLLRETIELNKALFKVLFKIENVEVAFPFQNEELCVQLSYNIGEFYQAILRGATITLEYKPSEYYKNWTGPPYVLRQRLHDQNHK